jgi:Zn-dependent metalloprotease
LLRQFAAQGAGAACEPDRTIFDAKNTTKLPGTKVRGEGDPPTNDAAADEAYDGFGSTFNLYREAFDRCSLDDEGQPIIGTVHFGQNFENAFFNGAQMVFGDGGEFFKRFTLVDVVAHELSHGVVADEAGLIYRNQHGALNESFADVGGIMVKQFVLNQTPEQSDWLIGEGIFTDQVQGKALRSMKEPGTAYDDPVLGKDPQPAHMRDYVRTLQDNGGVHINSGIPNKAFYLASINLGPQEFAWKKSGLIWYAALTGPMVTPFSFFRGFANATLAAAMDIFGQQAQEAVRDAWKEVGVL